MNTRIRQIAEQAFNKANDGTITDIKIPQMFIDTFAELIVKECAQVADCRSSFKHNTGSKILRHFDIKETV